jgi:hypothetical protein
MYGVIRYCSFSNLWNGIVMYCCNGFFLSHIRSSANLNDGLYVTYHGIGIFADHLDFVANSNSNIEMTGGQMYLTDASLFAGAHALLLDPASGQYPAFLFLFRVVGDATSGDVWSIPNSGGNFDLIECDQCWFSGSSSGYGINIENPNLNGLTLIGGWIRGNYLGGINYAAGSNLDVHDVKFSGNGSNNPSGVNGITVAAGQSHFHITNNIFGDQDGDRGNQTVGVYVASGASDYYIIMGNQDTTNNVSATCVSDKGTGTHKIVTNNSSW